MNSTIGGRNLTLLGVGAILIAVLTTGLSLFIYRQTGDIYLDRSRPGYLPDEQEVDEESEASVTFEYSDTGEIDKAELGEYLKELQKLNQRLQNINDPYSAAPLSDESLGIQPSSTPETPEGTIEQTN